MLATGLAERQPVLRRASDVPHRLRRRSIRPRTFRPGIFALRCVSRRRSQWPSLTSARIGSGTVRQLAPRTARWHGLLAALGLRSAAVRRPAGRSRRCDVRPRPFCLGANVGQGPRFLGCTHDRRIERGREGGHQPVVVLLRDRLVLVVVALAHSPASAPAGCWPRLRRSAATRRAGCRAWSAPSRRCRRPRCARNPVATSSSFISGVNDSTCAPVDQLVAGQLFDEEPIVRLVSR